MSKTPTITFVDQTTVLCCEGDWCINRLALLATTWQTLKKTLPPVSTIDASGISKLDTAGALFLHNVFDYFKKANKTTKLIHLNKPHEQLYRLIAHTQTTRTPKDLPVRHNELFIIGRAVFKKWSVLVTFLAFLGELAITVLRLLRKPKLIQWRMMWHLVQKVGYEALPIIALMSFLIGIVLAYQMGIQLKVYGANIFIVDVSGIAILREFAPLITAIIIAGRTSTSFTALLGAMKVNEEIDAMRTMGLEPMERLVVPRILALLISLPLLTIWAELFGIAGSMLMSKAMLAINYHAFLERFTEVVSVKQYILGMVKAPLFALIISTVGCFQGFLVSYSADSVGQKTTKSAVQAIFLIIIADALFSIIFSWLGV